MKHVIKYLWLIWFGVLYSAAGGQNIGLYSANLNSTSNNLTGKLTGEIYYLTIKANSHFFLQKEWTEGSITLKTGEVFDGLKMRYLAYGDEIVVYNSNNKMLVKADKHRVREFVLKTGEGDNIGYTEFLNLDTISTIYTNDFFEVVYKGTVMALISNTIVAKKVTPYNNVRGELTDTEYILRRTGYMYSPAKGLERIRFSNRSVAAYFPDNKHEIRKFLRQNKLRITKTNPSPQIFERLDREGFFD